MVSIGAEKQCSQQRLDILARGKGGNKDLDWKRKLQGEQKRHGVYKQGGAPWGEGEWEVRPHAKACGEQNGRPKESQGTHFSAETMNAGPSCPMDKNT